MVLMARKDFQGFIYLLQLIILLDEKFTTTVYSNRKSRFVNSAPTNEKNWPQNQSLFMTNETKSKCLPKFYVSSK